MKTYTSSIAPFLLLAAAACHEDKGNYTYTTLPVVTIDTTGTGTRDAYALYRYDTLRLAPVVLLDGTRVETDSRLDSQLAYHWSIYKATTGGTAYPLDTLADAPALDAPITVPSGMWTLLFTVTHLPTGIKTFLHVNLQVDEALSDGWMVLYERDGDTDAALIVNDRVKKSVTRDRLFLDIYSNSNGGQRLPGPPVAILHSIAPMSSAEVLLASERDLVAVEKNTFERLYTFEDLFWTPPATRALTYTGGNYTRRELAVNDNRVHYANYMSAGLFRVNALGIACTGTHGQLAPWLSSYFSSSFEAIAYDQTHQRFLCVQASGITLDTLDSADKTAFDVNNVGMTMLHSDYGRSNYEYSLMQQGTEHALLVSNFYTTNRSSAKIAIARHDMSDLPGITDVTTIAAGTLGEILYYASGPTLHLFKYNTTGPDRVTTAWSAPAGETITCARLQKFYYPIFATTGILINNGTVLYIATWNPATATGTVHQLLVDPSNGAVDPTSAATYTGFGKIKDMSWKWTL